MTDETPTTGPHDEWLTAELARLRATGKGEPPQIVLIAGLQKHAGLGVREAREAVEDFGRRNGLVWGAGVNSPAAAVLWMACLLLLLVVNAYPLLRTLMRGESLGVGSAAVPGLVSVVFLTLLVLEVRKHLRGRQA